jgi:predicted nucleotide-binding protein
MPYFTKGDALSKLGKLLEKERNITNGSYEQLGWHRSVKLAVARIFGEHSPQMDEISKASSLSLQKALLVSMVGEIEDWDDKALVVLDEEEAPLSHSQTMVPGNVQDRKRVFVVHGRNVILRVALFQFLRSIGLNPLEWSQAIKQTGKASPYIGEVLDTAFSKAQAVVVLMTPDDEASLRAELRTANDPPYEVMPTPQARPNVLFEAGMAMGRSADRTILVEVGDLRPFSDVGGRHVVRLNNSTERRQELAQRLETAGCTVDLTGTDWHREGNFQP